MDNNKDKLQQDISVTSQRTNAAAFQHTSTNTLFQQAVVSFQQANLEAAKKYSEIILNKNPNHAGSIHLLGLIAGERGNNSLAVQLITQAINLKPSDPTYHFNLGLALEKQGQLEQAGAAFSHVLKLDPLDFLAHVKQGILLCSLGSFVEAAKTARQALELNPKYADAYNVLGDACRGQGVSEQAISAYKQAIQLEPNSCRAYVSLAIVLGEIGHPEKALTCVNQALINSPENAHAHKTRGDLLRYLGKAKEAEYSYCRALEISPYDAKTHSNLLFLQASNVDMPAQDFLKELRRWDDIQGQKGRERQFPTLERESATGNRIRVGYVSANFHSHPVSYFFEPLLAAHDQSRFEIFCYDTKTNPADACTERLSSISEHWRIVTGHNDVDLAELVYNDRIEILVDLAGHTGGNRLGAFTYRPAPIQVTYLGFFAGTGLAAMDYWITDDVLHPPDTLEESTETIYRLARCWLAYRPPEDAPDVEPCPHNDDRVTFGSLHNISKLTPMVIETWSGILRDLPASRLLLMAGPMAEPSTRQVMLDQFTSHGIDSQRIILRAGVPHEQYLKTYGEIDIVLDPFPRTGGTTTVEALWMGVPVVTLAGQRYVERISASELTAAGLDEFIAYSKKDYIDKVKTLARDPERRAELRSGLRRKMTASSLCDGKDLAKAMESAFVEMLKK